MRTFSELEMDALTEALLVFAARRDHLETRIEPALDARWRKKSWYTGAIAVTTTFLFASILLAATQCLAADAAERGDAAAAELNTTMLDKVTKLIGEIDPDAPLESP